ncbi:hypothetical protein I7I50_12436 [Histoplasma capsulatum G186AR]|uniref:Uncharacterized protein n=1 Tax=Ajellomyces capsulatus TaxID=5037 RepID=A0A8H7YCS7_AJECA|nr:hypothetical protein I7I52_11257 [Histoplasma capsulatum]QSS70712.1 hypothetical protein I7I50_12436 [Histoplasma capsulatum G186AR]
MCSINSYILGRVAGSHSSRVVSSYFSLLQDGLRSSWASDLGPLISVQCDSPQCSSISQRFAIPQKYGHNLTVIKFVHTEPSSGLANSDSRTTRGPGSQGNYTPREKSRDKTKKPTSSPSAYLISVLENCGYDVGIAKPKSHSVDLSYNSPLATTRSSMKTRRKTKVKSSQYPNARLACATVVADYLRYVHPLLESEPSGPVSNQGFDKTLDNALLTVFNDEVVQYLSDRGYSIEDVMVWAWILASSQPLQAAMRYKIFEKRASENSLESAKVPLFVLLFTLRRESICATAFRILLFQAWDILSDNLSSDQTSEISSGPKRSAWNRSGDDNTIMILAVRLLRLAGQVWPQAFPSIAALITRTLGTASAANKSNEAYEKKIRGLTIYYNKLLSLLAIPCRLEPYRSAIFQQRAQFQLLREMSKFNPPLPVTREGYQAITNVQLAQKKTTLERQWANFKAQSWPPWKEEKLGIDFERGNEGSESRALKSISHMRDVGYGMTAWEQTAAIYAGWDTDKTPTIQTRTFLPKPNRFRMSSFSGQTSTQPSSRTGVGMTKTPDHGRYFDIWSARIRATRTLKEAWACFLSYRDSGLPPHKAIYFAMAEKIIFHDRSQNSHSQLSTEALPGDGKEVFPEPSSPQDVIYVHSEPPTLDDLLQQMISQNIRPSGKLLILLLVNSKSIETGIEYLLISNLSDQQKSALVSSLFRDQLVNEKSLADVPDDIFAAFIQLLCRFSVLNEPSADNSNTQMWQLFPVLFFAKKGSSLSPSDSNRSGEAEQFHRHKALTHAVQLMKSKLPRYFPAWSHFLSGLATDRVKFSNHKISIPMQRVISWWEVCHVLTWMQDANIPLESRGFEIACSALSRLILAARQDMEGAEHGLKIVENVTGQKYGSPESLSYSTIREMVQQSVALLKRQFDSVELTGGKKSILSSLGLSNENGESNIPAMLPGIFESTAPSLLHAYVRVLGLANDRAGLLELLRLMSKREAGLKFSANERMGGKRLVRRTVVAIRVFLEGDWELTSGVSEPGASYTSPALKHRSFICEGNNPVNSDISESTQKARAFADPIVNEAYDIIENTELLSPWPTDGEIKEYKAVLTGLRR